MINLILFVAFKNMNKINVHNKSIKGTNFNRRKIHSFIRSKSLLFAIDTYIIRSVYLSMFFVISLQEDQDWGFVAMVLDRLFLWMFSIASIAGTFTILCEAPALYDDTKPIDTEYSSVAQQQYLPQGQELLKSMVS